MAARNLIHFDARPKSLKSNLSDLPIGTGDLTGLDIGPRLETRSSDGYSKRELLARFSTLDGTLETRS